jgi:acid phosphatase (class A)
MSNLLFTMRRTLIAIVILLAPTLAAQGAGPHFLDPAAINAIELLPPPPGKDSAEATADLSAVLNAQTTRTDADVARATQEANLSPTAFQSVLGPDFTAEKLPQLFALLDDVAQDSKVISTNAKGVFARPRPQLADPRVQPVVQGDDEPSYPSGHATRAMLWARILCEIVPDKKHELLDRGEEIGWDRVLIGAHYPTDVYAGEVLGQALAQAMSKNADFQTRLAEAKEEFHAASATHPVAASLP